MTIQSVTIQMPVGLYNRLKRRAEQAHHSVEVEVLETVAASVPVDEELSRDLTEAVMRLAALDDDALWLVARAFFPVEKSIQLENLHFKRQDRGLNEAETQQAAELASKLEKFMFLRAQALALLMQRGHDVSTFANL